MVKKRNACVVFGVILFACVVVSCRHSESRKLLPELKQAESVMYDHPDSALYILKRIGTSELSDPFQNAAWCLLMTQAKDKNFEKHASDSLINIAYEYFMKCDDPHWKALAYNYKGVVSEELGDVEGAIQNYLEAGTQVEKTKDYQLAYLIYSNLGIVYTYRSLNDYALKSLQKAYEYAKLSGNKVYISAALSYIARAYSVQEDWPKTIRYYKESLQMAEASGSVREIVGIKGELSMIYAIVEDYDLALKLAKESLDIAEEEGLGIEQAMLRMGDIFRLRCAYDSAYYYLERALASDNIYTLRSAYHSLYALSKKQVKYAEAIDYNEKMWHCSDSIRSLERSRAIIEMQERYNQQKVLNEKNRLQIEKDRIWKIGLSVLILLLCGMIVIVYTYQRMLFRKQKLLQESKELVREYQQKINANEVLMYKNRSRIDELIGQIEISRNVKEQIDGGYQTLLMELQCQNEKLHRENNELQNKISGYFLSLQEKEKGQELLNVLSKDNLRLRARESFLCGELMARTKILNDLKTSPKYLDAILWDKVRLSVNELYDDFEKRLQKQFPSLTEGDIQLCCLIKLRFSISEIAIMRGVSPTSISQQKTRLKKRLSQELGDSYDDSQSLDLWLWDY